MIFGFLSGGFSLKSGRSLGESRIETAVPGLFLIWVCWLRKVGCWRGCEGVLHSSFSAFLGDVGMKWVSTPCDQLPSQELLMRVSSCKFLRPSLVCFSKSSVGHYPPATLELEDAQQEHACASPGPVPDAAQESPPEEKIEVEKVDDVRVEVILKSSFKRPTESGSKDVGKGRVKWMDFMGKELVEVKEFEARCWASVLKLDKYHTQKVMCLSDSGDSDDEADGNRGCFCTIQ